jgi:ubiquitin fusion degradation protein 1
LSCSLEQAFRNFSCLTKGDIVEISYNCLTFEILIMETVPDAESILIIDTDLEVSDVRVCDRQPLGGSTDS